LKAQMTAVAQAAALNSADPAKRIAALARIAATPDRRALTQVRALIADPAYAANPELKRAVDAAVSTIGRGIATGDVLATLYNGLSFASILFMAAIGLAVIFGLMGVINLAQGELIMIGGYVTWLVQEAMRHLVPGLLDWYLIVAIPVVFLVTAAIGIGLEAILLRHLYRRPLMSLLATWAVSLFLINLVRVTFGTQNLNFVTPFYVTGGVPVIGDFIFTWNRMFAIVFAILTLALTWGLMRLTPLGLNIRAVTQNRTMAGCIGIPVRRVDMMAFGLGSGLAGLAGLALAPIYSVNPQMGQNFIIDSFMVVVLGGVGTIVGTVVAALGIGQVNVLIEPLWGAVAAKVIVLLMIIAFLQWRPEGLFAIKGRRK
jgi:urea transport system permease protein